MRFREIEFRFSQINNKYELVKWYISSVMRTEGEMAGTYKLEDCCYVIAFFDKGKEGYDMRTVGSRFFDDKDAWIVGKSAMSFLQDTFEVEEMEKDT